MKHLQLLIFLIPLFVFTSSLKREHHSPQTVKGKIIDSDSQLPVESAYIYIISGEEEALSSKEGAFEITTWQAFPLAIKINHDLYRTSEVVYKTHGASPVIKLQRK